MSLDMDHIEYLLSKRLARRLEIEKSQKDNPSEDPEKRATYYQHRIWQLKDRLSCRIYGPDSEALTDEFIKESEIQVQKHRIII